MNNEYIFNTLMQEEIKCLSQGQKRIGLEVNPTTIESLTLLLKVTFLNPHHALNTQASQVITWDAKVFQVSTKYFGCPSIPINYLGYLGIPSTYLQ